MKKAFKIIVPILMVLLILASLVWYGFVYDRDFVRDLLLKQARYCSTRGHTTMSSWFYDLAYEHSGQSNNVAIELANQFKKSGNYTKAEATLSKAIADSATIELYMALCQVYVDQDKIIDAMAMLDNVTDPAIAEQLLRARPAMPTADLEPGFYNEYLSVNLDSNEGFIYYILNEQYPSFANDPFTSPILLPAGETQINAIVVGRNGLVSPIASFDYTIGGVVERVYFEDEVVEQAVRQQLYLGNSAIYSDQLWEIKNFVVPEGTQTLADLSRFAYLESLTIQNYTIDSLAFLGDLPSLRKLDLSGCRFPAADMNIIAALPNLQDLNLSRCGLSTLSGLENAIELSYLDLSENSVRNLSPLSSLLRMQELDLSHNAVTDLTQLTNMAHLTKLDVSYNSLGSIDPIAPCAKLTWLNASHNALTSVSAVTNLTGLTYLNLNMNSLTDVGAISSCTELRELHIANNTIYNISAFKALTKLEDFDFSHNAVTDLPKWSADDCALRLIDGSYNELSSLSALEGINSLNFVNMDYNKITSVKPLASCNTLVQINIFGNQIKDPQTITETDIIMNYDPTYSMTNLG